MHSDAPAHPADTPLSPLDPRFVSLLRVAMGRWALLLLAAAFAGEAAAGLPAGLLTLPALLISAVLVAVVPGRQYRRWGYAQEGDHLRVARGFVFHSDHVVPFTRVQHIDVTRGPLERARGLGTLTLYTAGTHNTSVVLPGLAHEQALAMRESIRARIPRRSA
ncbi:hypothetical protein EYB45_03475 [Erythrobacteraceae bacterium CFH 75059]|uniref:PH domain-containing protein n=1 Tax=Qipengyuania thermophila TaxID=2509361 RepID=UPI00101F5D2F|nr:PH domain-containing protein [Qipengyuania thermophila]TCD06759.1 hypothetical protein EYB45_03475 [Erythrobacteraceae bacterium CFH 75059]